MKADRDVVREFFSLQGKIDRISGKIVSLMDLLREIATDDSLLVDFVSGVDVDDVIHFYTVLKGDCEKILKILSEIKASYALG